MKADTPGKRVYLIRLALGDGFKVPMPMAAFAALLTERSGVAYDSSMISRMESGDRKVTLEDAPRLAALDPEHRGPGWIAWGVVPDISLDQLIRPDDHFLTAEDRDRLEAEARAQRPAAAARKRRSRGA